MFRENRQSKRDEAFALAAVAQVLGSVPGTRKVVSFVLHGLFPHKPSFKSLNAISCIWVAVLEKDMVD